MSRDNRSEIPDKFLPGVNQMKRQLIENPELKYIREDLIGK